MITDEVMELIKVLYGNLEELIELIGLEYTDNDEYVCHNTDQVDEKWCDEEMLADIENAYQDIGYFLGR